MARSAHDYQAEDAIMRVVNARNLLRVDWLLPILVLSLAAIGWVTMFSASANSENPYFEKQVGFFFAGAALAAAIVCVDYRMVVALAPLMYIIALLLLVGVQVAGTEVNGARRWLDFGLFRIQPSEITKIVMIYFLAWYFHALGPRIRKLHWFVLSFILTAIPMLFILKQPDLGTAACLGPLVVVMLFVAGCRLWHLGVVVLLGLSIIPLAWYQVRDFTPSANQREQDIQAAIYRAWRPPGELHWHQKMRIYTFLNPDFAPRINSWQAYQSFITVGSGGLSGKGFMNGTQTKLNYLPEHRTDFIFSHYAEERGFIGGVVIIGLFVAFLLRGLMYARDCPEMMGTLLAAGVVTVLGFHIFFNIAITIGLMPVTGMPLPFLSYGGTFYLSTMACVGILLNVPLRRKMFLDESMFA
ncbi:MAG: rod shape-determining protein RodA [Candidatus Hydrogenedentes bacterium]|nr:rod shape-determining protein RodA [Candidatus Hydrogenedentota bacterium]